MLVLATICVLLQPALDPSLINLTRHSSIVFNGTVERVRASTVDVPEEESTAIVRVEDVLTQPAELSALKGQRITARFGKSPSRTGQRGLFFTTLYSAGRSVGVDVNGVLAEVPPDGGRGLLAEARAAVVREDIAARVATATRVVAGTVRSVRRFDTPRVSEHDPEIAVADVVVQTTERGVKPETVQVWFASSYDPLFYDWPKLREGQRGVFIAHTNDPELRELRERAPRAPDGPYVIDPADVQPLEMLSVVRGVKP